MHGQATLEARISEWRAYAARRPELMTADVDELESHLREEVDALSGAGLASDEAFLVAVRRLGALDAVAQEFAREHSERLWKQLVLSGNTDAQRPAALREARAALLFAVAAGAAVKAPVLFGYEPTGAGADFYLRNLAFFVLPLLAAFLGWKRRLPLKRGAMLALPFVVIAALVNLYPLQPLGSTAVLVALHVPIALWLVVGVVYTGDRWAETAHRMNFVRFTGELVIYYALIALGGIVFTAFTAMLLQAVGIREPSVIGSWIVPCGAAGAVLVSAWLVEAKQNVIENMAPVLTRVFTPLFTLLLLGFLITVLATGRTLDVPREVLIGFDLLLAVVVGLVVYALSARDPQAPPDIFDRLQFVLITCALLANGLALAAIATRISEFGFSPNKVAALGENLVLLVNLAGSLLLSWRFIRGRGSVAALEHWHTVYLSVFAWWAAIVALLFPPLFGWI